MTINSDGTTSSFAFRGDNLSECRLSFSLTADVELLVRDPSQQLHLAQSNQLIDLAEREK